MKCLFVVLALLITTTTYSQTTFNFEDAIVTRGDLETNVYEKDSTANALIIFELGNSYVDKNNFRLKTEIKKKLKILNKNGFNKATEVIYLYTNKSNKEKVLDVNATTHNLENGEVSTVKLSKSEIFEEKYNDRYSIVKFTFPNIKEGSVVTFSYTIESPFMFKYKAWEFQSDIPKLFSVYRTSIPGNWDYHAKLVGHLKLFQTEQSHESNCLQTGSGGTANCANTVYVMKDIPAFIQEDYMTTKENYLSRIEYELKTFRGFDGRVNNYSKSWKTVNTELKTDKNIGRQLGKSSYTKTLLDDSITSESDPLKKASAIFKYVQNNYTWNTKYNIFNAVSVKNLIKNKSGNVSEINILLYNLLNEVGIDVKPILLSTRPNGLPTKLYPVISDFNYLIVQATIDGKSYLLDATDDFLSFGQIPFRCLNQFGRLFDFKSDSKWIDIEPDKITTIQHKVNLTLNDDDTFSGNIKTTTSGYQALRYKKRYFKNNPEDYFNTYKNTYSNIEFLDYQVETDDKTNPRFIESFDISYTANTINDKIYIDPFLIKFFTENPFKLQERSYPIDFGYKDAFLYTLKIDFSENYEILDKPSELKLSLPNNKGSLILTTKIDGNSIMLFFKFNFSGAIYDPSYYESLKQFMSTIVDVQNNSLIVLKKKL
ncbi:hypothetical protein A9Q87_00655 [Flavobacteriales bacterium 34_180_T64]|nr:hypothetical protein A9Q87_00655 [Flavobacteriales bacterium 34_180_T64]